MMYIMTEADSEVPASEQITTVPFNLSLVALIVNLDTSGMAFAAELLEKVNIVELIDKCNIPLVGFILVTAYEYLVGIIPFSGMRKKLHSRCDPVTLHVKSS